jgi:hypothetical protein
MAYVTLTNITVLDNPTAFTNPFQFEVTFECAHALEDGALGCMRPLRGLETRRRRLL